LAGNDADLTSLSCASDKPINKKPIHTRAFRRVRMVPLLPFVSPSIPQTFGHKQRCAREKD
jgi:hypothetical protein